MDGRKRPLAEVLTPDDGFKTPEKRAPQPGLLEPDHTRWGVEQTGRYLRAEGLGQWEDAFREQKITGVGLQYLKDADLEKMGLQLLGDRLRVLHSLRKLWLREAEPNKVFNDPVHGHVELPPLLLFFIDTPQFQRLRRIKQLGAVYFVFPGASHNRFEHCIGAPGPGSEPAAAGPPHLPPRRTVCADRRALPRPGPSPPAGHGPFSHMFDNMFIPKARPGITWKHEKASLDMFDYLVADNQLQPLMERHGLVLPDDLDFIKEQIGGPEAPARGHKWPFKGRPEDKSFLYEIVANKRNGIDVDKWDYFARDCHHLGIQNNFDYRRFLKFARVCEVDGQKRICTRDKEVSNLYDMFHMRNCLHRRAYQHKVSNIIETMITEAFLKADEHIKFEGSGGKMFTLSTAIDDMEAYTKLTDNVFELILNSSDPALKDSREILRNVVCRRLYKCLGQTQADKPRSATREDILSWEAALARSVLQSGAQDVRLQPEDFLVSVIDMDYGMKDKNPVNHVHFYCKDDPDKAIRIRKNQVSKLLPEQFAEQLIRVYCKKTDERSLEAAKKHFVQWCMDENFSKPQDGDVIAPELTPLKASWAVKDEEEDEEDEEEEGEEGGRDVNHGNGPKKARTQLFKR
ncbi:deoxynucleoside triphosphate triphosphohydrolase SAMHD1 isoform X3 [Pseudoliparis swirei]|uniref:deoxynucleoside triphosphate triphosphohydrolase SAMHD1 isoform X3 n=1 Tax=Pseudoliparis swirei TaxID=2059687 RepID=UPI0024BDFA7E|nr:deoxynucleoside triphosphate triphosphohydrolase SAMHD1 isoform X3 [Pseudoliparis swirei]